MRAILFATALLALPTAAAHPEVECLGTGWHDPDADWEIYIEGDNDGRTRVRAGYGAVGGEVNQTCAILPTHQGP